MIFVLEMSISTAVAHLGPRRNLICPLKFSYPHLIIPKIFRD